MKVYDYDNIIDVKIKGVSAAKLKQYFDRGGLLFILGGSSMQIDPRDTKSRLTIIKRQGRIKGL